MQRTHYRQGSLPLYCLMATNMKTIVSQSLSVSLFPVFLGRQVNLVSAILSWVDTTVLVSLIFYLQFIYRNNFSTVTLLIHLLLIASPQIFCTFLCNRYHLPIMSYASIFPVLVLKFLFPFCFTDELEHSVLCQTEVVTSILVSLISGRDICVYLLGMMFAVYWFPCFVSF